MRLKHGWAVAFTLPMFLNPHVAWGWSATGHKVVAAIADKYLTTEARARLRSLIGSEHLDFEGLSSWADDVRKFSRPETIEFHFVNIPIQEAQFNQQRDCPSSRCVVDKLQYYAMKLPPLEPNAARWMHEEQVDALRFLIHFMGDIHQPLHTANDPTYDGTKCKDGAKDRGDRGGGCKRVQSPGQKESNLHDVWDERILRDAMDALSLTDPNNYANHLALNVLTQDVEVPGEYSFETWANEGHALAQAIYKELPTPRDEDSVYELPASYSSDNKAVVEIQLKRAGVRLAQVLNKVLAQPAPSPSDSSTP